MKKFELFVRKNKFLSIGIILTISLLATYFTFIQRTDIKFFIGEVNASPLDKTPSDFEDDLLSEEDTLEDSESTITEDAEESLIEGEGMVDEEEGLEEEANKEIIQEENKTEAEPIKQEEGKKELEYSLRDPLTPSNPKDDGESNEPESVGEINVGILKRDLNSYVLEVIKTYPVGKLPYLLNNDYANYNGVTVNLNYQDRLLLKAHPSGNRASHCSGITFEVFFKAMQQRNREAGLSIDDFNGMSYEELFDFVLIWYVANSHKPTNNIAVAMEKYGIGTRVTNFENAKAGDFLDFSRENNTGHTVVFLNWIRDNGKIVGLRYWSSQSSTNGINYREEYFNVRRSDGTKYGNIIIDEVYIGRVGSINNYR